jgi:hypothetical protein
MKILTKIVLFVILLGVAFLNTTCSDDRWFAKVTYEGYVYDSLGGKPVEGIWVSLEACERGIQRDQCQTYVVGQSKTDVSGRFYIHDNAAKSGRYTPVINGVYIDSDINTPASKLSSSYKYIYLNKVP